MARSRKNNLTVSPQLIPATEADSDFAYGIKKSAIEKYVCKTWGWDEVFQREYHQRHWRCENMRIITVDGARVGTLTVIKRSHDIFVESIYIHPDHQSRGIGTKLMQDIVDEAGDTTVRLSVLKANPAIRLYERLGFTMAGETANHYQMECLPTE